MRRWIIRKLKGFATLDEALEATDRNRVLSLAVARLFNTIGAEDILREVDGKWLFLDKPLNDSRKNLIQAEAKQLVESEIWKVLSVDLRWQANKKMYLLAENEMHVATGKLWTLMLDCFETRLNSLSKGSGLFNRK